MKTVFFSVLLGLTLLLAISCTRKQHGETGKSVFRYNESAGITSLDPAFARNQANIWAVNQIFNGLVQLDDSLKAIPCIAKSWQISADGLTYTFKLRDDVFFHNSTVFPGKKGRRVVAEDFVYSFNRIVDPGLASPGAWIFAQVFHQGEKYAFDAPNDSTFILKLSKPFPPFIGLLCMQYCSVVPHEAVEKYGADFRQHPVGTGPFYFKLWKEGVKLVMLKNPSYFEFESGKRLPFLDAVAVTFIVDKQSAFLEFVKGNLDFMSGIDASYKDEMLTKAGTLNPKYNNRISLIKHPYLNTEYLGILCDKNNDILKGSPLENRDIRQAMNYGFDRIRMMQYLRNNIGIPGTRGFVPAGVPWFDQSKIEGYTYNPVKARELLAKAGFPAGKGLPAITLSTNASYLDLCKYIQSQLNELGFTIKIDVSPPATLREMIAQSRIPFFRGSWIADYPEAENYLSLFYTPNFCPSGPNYTHYSNQEYDRLYRESISITDDSVRAGYYMQMDNLLMIDAPVIVLYYDQVLRFTSKKISSLGCNALNLLNLKKVRKSND